MNESLLARCDDKIERIPFSACWHWVGSSNGSGYGQIAVKSADGKWRPAYAHRLAYEHWNGPIPEGLVVDHLCRNPACVNPAHLEAVTDRENIRRGVCGIAEATKRKCTRGHKFDEANTYISPKGGRECRACRVIRVRAHHARRSEVANAS